MSITTAVPTSFAIGDVNGDHNPDFYVGGRTGNANAPDYLLLGNATGGDFLVLNGGGDSANIAGPIQMLTLSCW